MTTSQRRLTVSGIAVEVVRKDIKNLHLGVYPPAGRVRVAAPLVLSDEAVRLAVIDKLGWIKRQKTRFVEQPRQSAREMVNGSRTEDAFSRFEVLERRADFAEGRADALGMTGPKSLEEEIADLRASDSVDAELEAMKAALKAKGA